MRILIVEDDKLLAAALADLLEARGFETETVWDGESGAAYGELGVYDLVILDVMLPKMDGRQVARQLRERRCGVPILMLTARSGVSDRVEGLEAGADTTCPSPLTPGSSSPASTPFSAARGDRWTSCAGATRVWTWPPGCSPAGTGR